MRILTWNVRRAAGSSKVWDYIREADPCISMLQEVTQIPADIQLSHHIAFEPADSTVDRQVVATVKVIAKEGEDSYRVRYGGSAVTDGCPSNSIVVGLNPEGDNFLAVKAKPSLASARIDKLGPGAEVYHCDTSPNGKWIGIVYDGDGKWTGRCGVTSPVFRRKPYQGPCQSGWVSSKYIELVAG